MTPDSGIGTLVIDWHAGLVFLSWRRFLLAEHDSSLKYPQRRLVECPRQLYFKEGAQYNHPIEGETSAKEQENPEKTPTNPVLSESTWKIHTTSGVLKSTETALAMATSILGVSRLLSLIFNMKFTLRWIQSVVDTIMLFDCFIRAVIYKEVLIWWIVEINGMRKVRRALQSLPNVGKGSIVCSLVVKMATFVK